MNKEEVNTAGTIGSRTATLDETTAALQWEAIDWQQVEAFINKAQTRMAKAHVRGNQKVVKELQRMLTHSYYAKLWAIRTVTGTRGKRTAGIDQEKWDSPAKKYQAVSKLEQKPYRAQALKRVYIPKSNGKQRPLSIPTMTDRARQTLEALALDPLVESNSDTRSFGFRKGWSSQDAMAQLFINVARRDSPQWIVEGDIKACFDEIAHEWLLQHTPMDPIILGQFLKAGYVYQRQRFPTERGTPQGGTISPILANHTLNGIEQLLAKTSSVSSEGKGKSYRKLYPKVHLVRYADDFVITARSKELAEQAQETVRNHIAERGLQLSEEKTAVTNIADGFDFLGWNFRKYRGKLLIKPSKKAQQSIMGNIRKAIRSNIGTPQDDLIKLLNSILRGWSRYHQCVVAKRTYSAIDNQTFWLLWKWARRRHPNKGRRWIKQRSWKTEGRRHWVFKDTLTLLSMSDTKIVRHLPLKLDKNPYIDQDYFARRRFKLLVNRTFGTTRQKPLAKAGGSPEGVRLHEA